MAVPHGAPGTLGHAPGCCAHPARRTHARPQAVETAQRAMQASKTVRPVSSGDRELVHLLMHLSSLASAVDKITVRSRAREVSQATRGGPPGGGGSRALARARARPRNPRRG
jgi:hypothetical protein